MHERYLLRLILATLVVLRVVAGPLGIVAAIAVMLPVASVAEWLGSRGFATGF